MVHDAGALLYLDGANMNALVGLVRPGDLGFDIMHLNLHKTFSTPHGGGGPAAGPVGVSQALTPFLPFLACVKRSKAIPWKKALRFPSERCAPSTETLSFSCGPTRTSGALARGLRKSTEIAILNANYLRVKLRDAYQVAIDDPACTNASSPRPSRSRRASRPSISPNACSIRLSPPTIYFPLIVDEAMMIEPRKPNPSKRLINSSTRCT